MDAPVSDKDLAKALRQLGLVSAEGIEAAVRAQAESTRLGMKLSLGDVLVHQGVITQPVRENLEKRIRATQAGGLNQLGNYRLLKKISEGGMGTVYLAEDVNLGRRVAVKVLLKKFTDDPDFLARFRREAQAAAQLTHVNVVNAFAIGEEIGFHYFVMEFCEGENLQALLQRDGRLPEKQVLDIAIQAARGLQCVHRAGLVHRDIKPSNLFLTRDGVVKIVDLGLAKGIERVGDAISTSSGIALGTPHYISPEQARGEHNLDGRADIYSLGATLFHLLSGRTVFGGTSSAGILIKHLTEPAPDVRELSPGVSEGLARVLLRMLEKRPEDRFPDVGALLAELERIAAGRHFKAARVGRGAAHAARTPARIPATPTATQPGGDAADIGVAAGAETGAVTAQTAAPVVPAPAVPAPAARRLTTYLYWGGSMLLVVCLFILLITWVGNAGRPPPARSASSASPLSPKGGEDAGAQLPAKVEKAGKAPLAPPVGPPAAPPERPPDPPPDQPALKPGTSPEPDTTTAQAVNVKPPPLANVTEVLPATGALLSPPNPEETAKAVVPPPVAKAEPPPQPSPLPGARKLRLPDKEGLICTFKGHAGVACGLDLSADGRRLASASRDDKTVRVWDVETGKELKRFDEVFAPATVVISPNGSYLAWSSHDRSGTRVCEWETGREILAFPGRLSLFFTHDSSELIAGTACYALPGGGPKRNLKFGLPADAVALADGKRAVAVLNGFRFGFFSLDDGRYLAELGSFPGPHSSRYSVQVLGDGRAIRGSGEYRAHVWAGFDLDSGKGIRHWAGCDSVSFSPDGRRVALPKGATYLLVDLAQNKVIGVYPCPHGGNFTRALFTPDGGYLIGGSGNPSEFHLWGLPRTAVPAAWSGAKVEAFARQVLSSPPNTQLSLIRQALQALNPVFQDTPPKVRLQAGQIGGFTCQEPALSDISPLRALRSLQELDLSRTFVSDLAPLQGAPLRTLNLSGTQVCDLTPLRGMPLETLDIGGTPVEDLSPLRGMNLTTVFLNANDLRGSLEPLREMRSLKTINKTPAAEFWKAFDAGTAK